MLNKPLPPLETLSFDLPRVWDSTMIVAFRKCPTYFLNAYVNHLRGGSTALPLRFGGAFAAGLEGYRQAWHACNHSNQIAMENAYNLALKRWDFHENTFEGDNKRSFSNVIRALMEYFKNWPIDTDLLQPHFDPTTGRPTFEYSFAVPLDPADGFPLHPSGEPFIICGRMDTLGTYDGLPIIADEKTTTYMGPKWAEQWTTRHQFALYLWALRKLAFKARHYMVRGICLRKDGVDFAQTPPQRVQDYHLDSIAEELRNTLNDALEMSAERLFPRAFGDACYSYYRKCNFWDSCSAKPTNRLSFLKSIPRSEWNPLAVETEGS